jgi:hypothetical protein
MVFTMPWKCQPKRMVLPWDTGFSKNAHTSQNATKLESVKNLVSQKMTIPFGWNFQNILRTIIRMLRQHFIMLFVSVVSKIYSRFIFRRTFGTPCTGLCTQKWVHYRIGQRVRPSVYTITLENMNRLSWNFCA